MNTEDYVSYPLAIALKKAGFDVPCMAFYEHTDGQMWVADGEEDWNSGIDYSAPSLCQAQKWLRDRYGIHINVCIYSDYPSDGKVCDRCFWGFELYAIGNAERIAIGDGMYDSYEQTLSAGIAAALELIEKKGE